MVGESLERDLGASEDSVKASLNYGTGNLAITFGSTQITNISELEICGPVIITEESSGRVKLDFVLPVQTVELAVQPSSSDELIRRSIVPYDVTWATQVRFVIYQLGTNGSDYQLEYYDGSAWVSEGAVYTTGAANALSYVSMWRDISSAWKGFGDCFVRLRSTAEPDAAVDTPYAALQFRRSCSVCGTLDTAPSCGVVTIIPSDLPGGYRADTTLVTADTIIITADYSL